MRAQLGGAGEGYLSSTFPTLGASILGANRTTIIRACAAGLVPGSEKRGRDWWVPSEGWAEYRRSVGARLRPVRTPEAPLSSQPSADDAVLRELGARRIA